MNMLSTPDNEQQRQAAEIHDLAEQYHINEDIVRSIYQREMKMFHSTAHITQYLSLLASRHVKELIRLGLIDADQG